MTEVHRRQSEMALGLECGPVAASKQGRIGEGGGEGEKSNLSDSEASALEWYEERAGIYEFDARMSRVKAQSMALRDVSERYGTAMAKRVKEAGQ